MSKQRRFLSRIFMQGTFSLRIFVLRIFLARTFSKGLIFEDILSKDKRTETFLKGHFSMNSFIIDCSSMVNERSCQEIFKFKVSIHLSMVVKGSETVTFSYFVGKHIQSV